MSKTGKRRVREAIEAAEPVTQPPDPPMGPAATTPSYLSGRFDMRADGLWRKNQDDSATWLSGPLTIEAETRDDEGRGWGVLLSWRDRDGGLHEEAFGRAMFAGECSDVRARLADGGLPLNNAQSARQAFAEFLAVIASPVRARSVSKIGWHQISGRLVFVLPGRTFGDVAERVVLQVPDAERNLFNVSGTLADWREQIGRRCLGNSRLMFAASCAFAAPLLGLVGEDGGGFNLRGASRSGKSTALRVAASVCGGSTSAGAAGFVRGWRATGNGIEGVAAAHNDCLLPLDEMGQVDGRELGEIAYLLANGLGKVRGQRTGGARAGIRFRTLFLSTGEIGLAEKNAEGGRATRAGMEVRCVDIPADAGAGFGLFEELHGEASPDAFARELNQVTRRVFGSPLSAFLDRLAERLRRDPAAASEELRDRLAEIARGLLDPRPDATGQVRSVASRFAIVALGGELASEWMLTEWPAGRATEAITACFDAWLAERGTTGAREDAQAASQLRAFIARHGAARFEDWREPQARPQEEQVAPQDSSPPAERFRTGNRAGWRRWVERPDGRWVWRYYLTADGMREAMDGLSPREATQALAAAGLIRSCPRSWCSNCG